MAQQRFPSPNLIQGSIGPASAGTVSVPLKDPGLAEEADLYGTLSKRMDQVAAMGFKIAGQQAKAAGAAFGAKNAPTADQIKLAALSGKPVDLPGDASSLKIYDQAAYASSLSVLEDRIEIAGRRALTTAFAEAAADPEMDPQSFTAKLDSVVTEYSSTLSTVSPSSGAKVNAALGIVANSQVVSFSREFMAKQIKARKNAALEGSNAFIDNGVDTIYGHQSGGDITLLEKIKKDRRRGRTVLEKAHHNETTIQSWERRFDKAIKKARIAAVLQWTRTSDFDGDPVGAFRELRKFEQGKQSEVPQHIKDIYKTASPGAKNEIIEEVLKGAKVVNSADDIVNKRGDRARSESVIRATTDFNNAVVDGFNRTKMQAAINILRSLGENTDDLEQQLDAGPVVRTESKKSDVLNLTRKFNLGVLTYKDLNDAELTEDDLAKFLDNMTSQRDRNVRAALNEIKNHPKLSEIPLEELEDHDLNPAQRRARTRFDRARQIVYEKRRAFMATIRKKERDGVELTKDDFFDAGKEASDAMKQIVNEMETAERKGFENSRDKGFAILGDKYPQTLAGLRKYLRENRRVNSNKVAVEKAVRAIEALDELDD